MRTFRAEIPHRASTTAVGWIPGARWIAWRVKKEEDLQKRRIRIVHAEGTPAGDRPVRAGVSTVLPMITAEASVDSRCFLYFGLAGK